MIERYLENEEEIPVLEVEKPWHHKLAQEYVAQQDSGFLVTDYQVPFASRSAAEYLSGEVPESRRVTGGRTVYPDQGAWSLLKSNGCRQNFQNDIFPAVDELTDGEAIHPDETINQKDIFLEGNPEMKAVAMAGRLTPRVYGAFVREQSPADETYRIMAEDEVDVEEHRARQFAFEDETGDRLWDELIGDRAYNVSPEELQEELADQNLDLDGYGNMTQPESCITSISREEGKPVV